MRGSYFYLLILDSEWGVVCWHCRSGAEANTCGVSSPAPHADVLVVCRGCVEHVIHCRNLGGVPSTEVLIED